LEFVGKIRKRTAAEWRVALLFEVMLSVEIARVLDQHARRRAAGQPVPVVLIGSEPLDGWIAFAKGAPVVRSVATDPETAARAYLEDARVRARLRDILEARAVAVRGVCGSRARSIVTTIERDN
jgi:hypothetical protein